MPLRKVLADLGRGVWSPSGNKKNHQKNAALYYQGASHSSLPGRHIYYEPPDEFEWSADSALIPNSKTSSGEVIVHRRDSSVTRRSSKPEIKQTQVDNTASIESKTAQKTTDNAGNRAYTQEEFTSAILARTQPGSADRKTSPSKHPLPSHCSISREAPDCDISSIVNPIPNDLLANNCAVESETSKISRDPMGENCVAPVPRNSAHASEPVSRKCECEKRGSNPVQHSLDCKADPRTSDYAVSPLLERRNKGVLGRLKNFASRTSYSTSEDGHSHSSDYEEQEDDKKVEMRFARDAKERSSSSWAGRVRHLHRDVKKKISRLRHSRGTTPDDENRESIEIQDCAIHTGSSVESIPSGSGSSLQPPTPTSSNRSSTSAGEDENSPYVGTFLGRARALVDCTPSPYDRDGLGFKKGDLIDIIAKHKTGIWVGMAQGKVGHFKFINVEEIMEDTKPRNRRHRTPPNWLSTTKKPETLEQLLKQLGLQEYMNVLVLNGYDELDTFKEIEKDDLDGLGIINPEHGLKLMRAAEMLQGMDVDVEEDEEDEQLKQSPRDSGCYASHENLIQRETSQRALHGGQFVVDGEDQDTSHSESGVHSREGQDLSSAMNNLDLSAESSTKSTATTMDSREDVAVVTDTTEFSEDPTSCYNIPPNVELSEEPEHRTSVSEVNFPDSQSLDETFTEETTPDLTQTEPFFPVTTFANSFSITAASERYSSLPNYPQQTQALTNGFKNSSAKSRNKHSRSKQCSHRAKQEAVSNHISYYSQTLTSAKNWEIPDICLDRSSYIYGWASFSKEKQTRRRVQEYDDVVSDPAIEPEKSPGRHVYRKAKQRKGSLQALVHSPRPPSPTLLGIVKQKLDSERINLYEEPYSDTTGFCGIPPALVQRYAAELQHSLGDVADALDQVRITVLQQQARRGVPNDFLADSCTVPVIEANYSCLHYWLVSLGLPMYEENLTSSGFRHLDQVATLSVPDLADIGVLDPYHQAYLESAIAALQSRIGPQRTASSPSPLPQPTASTSTS